MGPRESHITPTPSLPTHRIVALFIFLDAFLITTSFILSIRNQSNLDFLMYPSKKQNKTKQKNKQKTQHSNPQTKENLNSC